MDIEDDDTAIFNEQREAINKEIDSYNNRIQFLNTEITICEGNIARFKEADFTDEVLDKIEQDLLKKKELIKEYIKVIRPYRLTKARLILEVESKQTNYCILFEPRNSKKKMLVYSIFFSTVAKRIIKDLYSTFGKLLLYSYG